MLYLIQKLQESNDALQDKLQAEISKIKKEENWPFSLYDQCSEDERLWIALQCGWHHKTVGELDKLRHSLKGKWIWVPKKNCKIYTDGENFIWQSKSRKARPTMTISRVEELPKEFDKQIIYLDEDKLVGELNLRPWKTGDRIHSLGLSGSQLVSDIIKDAKIPPTEKEDVLVLEDQINIHWVIGLKVGKKAIATSTSVQNLKIKIFSIKL